MTAGEALKEIARLVGRNAFLLVEGEEDKLCWNEVVYRRGGRKITFSGASNDPAEIAVKALEDLKKYLGEEQG